VFATEHQEEQSSSSSLFPRWRVTAIADVPLIACQSGSMSDSTTSSLENFNLSSVDGTANPGYHSSDSERSTAQDHSGEMDLMPASSTNSFGQPPGVSSTQKAMHSSAANADSWVPHSHRENEASASDDTNDVDLHSTGEVMEPGSSRPYQHVSDDAMDESRRESSGSASHQQTSAATGARLVVSSPALNQQSSVRVPAPMPHTCSSLVSNNAASYYSDSELIPQRNSVSHNVAKMVATEYLVLKQQPKVPRVFVLSSSEASGEGVPRSKWKPLTTEQRRRNRAVIQKELHQWQRSLSAGDTPASRNLLPGDAGAGSSKPRAGVRSKLLKHTVSSPDHGPVHGSADVAGVTPDSLLPFLSSLHPSGVSSAAPDLAANHSSCINNTDDAVAPETPEHSVTEITSSQASAKEDGKLENVQSDDGVFEEESGNNQKSSSTVVIDTWQADGLDQSASTSADSPFGHRNGVPNRAILRRGSGK